ncbi:30S ribosomal protein S11 [candidate division WWE3 bacterium CG08_land_8_20_14_0_20_40_13]|uniref:Small ribosomal subunit protein uS11 n=1 Tax=candidate division WWE3 bacterium CG08_land_8_20_14_0_20_40_13 TaxID=1975084 RepID=A0A2H0XGW4_UNCKA|nr:MAG: 30S ribosomal protein S11 [candidate division WWE3 bacterium CG08_land_8_20_14_0_20_40_13]
MPKEKKILETARINVFAGFNNIIITVSDPSGDVICWGSSGGSKFKGARKSTPYAAGVVGFDVGKKAYDMGVRTASVIVKGPGSGRITAIKSLRTAGINLSSIADMTPIPHNGCRPRKRRRV